MSDIFTSIRALAKLGFGVDDICVELKISDRECVRRIVFACYPVECLPADGVVRVKA